MRTSSPLVDLRDRTDRARTSPRRLRLRWLLGALAAALLIAPSFGDASDDPRRRTPPPDGLRANIPQAFAIVGADIVVKPGEVIEGATLIIRDGKIAAVAKDLAVPADAESIDAKGKRVYAGFIDAYAELPAEQSSKDPALSDAPTAKHWNTNVTPQISAARILAIDAAAHNSLRRSGIVARLYAPGAGIIKGTAALVSTIEGGAGDTAILAQDVAQVAQVVPSRRGFGGGGGAPQTTGSSYPGSPMGAFALVRQAFYDADWYQKAQDAVAKDPTLPLPERNEALAALAPALAGEMPVMFRNRDELYVGRSDKIAQEFKLKAIQVGSGYEYRRASLVAEAADPIILPVNFPRPPEVSTPEQADNTSLEDLMHWDLAPSNAQYVNETGLQFAFTTDGLRRIDSEFLANIRRCIARGLPADAALAGLTTNAAEILGASELLGSIEAGKLASFVITDGDLFAERSRARILETWVDGKRHMIVRDPVVDFRGTWELTVPEQKPVKVEIGGRPERMTGRVVSPEQTTRPSRGGRGGDEPETRPEGEGLARKRIAKTRRNSPMSRQSSRSLRSLTPPPARCRDGGCPRRAKKHWR